MKVERRNDKEHQRLRQQAYQEAQQALLELHRLMTQSNQAGSVGRTVALAARMGLLQPSLALVR